MLKVDGFYVAQNVVQGVAQNDAQDNLDYFIMRCIKENNKITRDEIARRAGKSKKTIERHLAAMRDKVVFYGSGYSGYWKIVEDTGD